MEELLVSSLAQTDALAKLLIEKGLITREELMQKIVEERGPINECYKTRERHDKAKLLLDLFTGVTWNKFKESGGKVSGFRESRWATVQKNKPGVGKRLS
jgi:hypothetical protein